MVVSLGLCFESVLGAHLILILSVDVKADYLVPTELLLTWFNFKSFYFQEYFCTESDFMARLNFEPSFRLEEDLN